MALNKPVMNQAKKSWGLQERRGLITGLSFIALWIIGFFAFYLYPMVASLYFSFTEYHIKQPKIWIGLQNYTQVFHDPLFWKSLSNTIYMVIIGISLSLFFSFICAVLLNLKVKGQSLYRIIYFIPAIVPTVASTLLFTWILNPNIGYVNTILDWIGIRGPNWFNDPNWSKPALILLGFWGMGQSIMIYLSGLQDVPVSLIEAAELDGASWLQRLRHVTLPMVSPITLFMLVMGVIGMFQYFAQAYVFASASSTSSAYTLGAPQYSTLFYSVYLYSQGFRSLNLGYASAMAWILFLIILLSTVILLKWSNRWTYYAG